LVAQARQLEIAGAVWGVDGAQVAIPPFTPVDMTLTDGAFWMVAQSDAPSTFCAKLNHYRATMGEPALVRGLPEWGAGGLCGVGGGAPGAGPEYRSAGHGYAVGYGGDWALERENSWWAGDGLGTYDQARFRHADGTTLIALTGTSEWGGDPDRCLAGVRAGIEGLENSGPVQPLPSVDAGPLGLPVPGEAAAVYTYVMGSAGGGETRIAYVECATLAPGRSNLVVLFESTDGLYEQRLTARDAFLRGFRFDGAPGWTPQPGEQAPADAPAEPTPGSPRIVPRDRVL
jgi:hypothetical protein